MVASTGQSCPFHRNGRTQPATARRSSTPRASSWRGRRTSRSTRSRGAPAWGRRRCTATSRTARRWRRRSRPSCTRRSARHVAEHAGRPDAFDRLLDVIVACAIRSHGLTDVVRESPEAWRQMERMRDELIDLVEGPLDEAKAAGPRRPRRARGGRLPAAGDDRRRADRRRRAGPPARDRRAGAGPGGAGDGGLSGAQRGAFLAHRGRMGPGGEIHYRMATEAPRSTGLPLQRFASASRWLAPMLATG